MSLQVSANTILLSNYTMQLHCLRVETCPLTQGYRKNLNFSTLINGLAGDRARIACATHMGDGPNHSGINLTAFCTTCILYHALYFQNFFLHTLYVCQQPRNPHAPLTSSVKAPIGAPDNPDTTKMRFQPERSRLLQGQRRRRCLAIKWRSWRELIRRSRRTFLGTMKPTPFPPAYDAAAAAISGPFWTTVGRSVGWA
jgi:hypothetical protein